MRSRLAPIAVVCGMLLAACSQATPTPTEVAAKPTATTRATATPAEQKQVATPTVAAPEATVTTQASATRTEQEPTAAPTQTAPPPTAAVRATTAPATASPTAVDTQAGYEPTFEEALCPFAIPGGQEEGETIECGYLVVPEARADPDSPTIRLAVAIFRRPGGAAHADPIIYLSGGPGGSALEFIGLTFGRLIEPVFAANRDIILFDQRGVGYSEPALDCPKMNELGLELLDNELDGVQLDDQEMFDLMLETLMACKDDLSAVANLSAYNSVANAADVNDLRIALGYDLVNLWGASYGTRLALGVMRDYPDGVRSVVLDSVYPPDVDLYLEAATNVDRAFNVLFNGCAADDACNAAYPGLRSVLFDTVDRLNETSAGFQITNPFTRESYDALLDGNGLLDSLFQMLYDTDVLPSLPQIIYDTREGDFNTIALIFGSLLAQQEAVSRGMQFSVQCHEELAFSSLERFEAVLADYPDLAGFLEYSVVGKLSFKVCAGWDSGQADALENEPVTSDIPTLVMAGEFDPITPPAWGRQAAETLPGGYFFEYPGVGHGASVVAGCPRDMLVAFLNDPAVAPDDACIGEMDLPKFVLPAEPGKVVELEPFTNDAMGISGLAPVGWSEVGPGVFSRGNSALDVAVLIAQASPDSAQDLLNTLTGQLGLAEAPQSVGEREANDLVWTLYAVEVQAVSVDFALAESEGLALIVVLQSAPGEQNELYEAVFLPAVDALAPLE